MDRSKQYYMVESLNQISDAIMADEIRQGVMQAVSGYNNQYSYEFRFQIDGDDPQENMINEETLHMILHNVWGNKEFFDNHHHAQFGDRELFQFLFTKVGVDNRSINHYYYVNNRITFGIFIYDDKKQKPADENEIKSIYQSLDLFLTTYFTARGDRFVIGYTND